MNPIEKHYHDVVRQDAILCDNLSGVHLLPALKKAELRLKGKNFVDNQIISSLAALKIITGQSPCFAEQKPAESKSPKKERVLQRVVGSRVTLRGAQLYEFIYKIFFSVFPNMRQFEGLKAPRHKDTYCFTIQDVFSLEELIPFFSYFEDLESLQCQLHFKTKNKTEVLSLGHGLQLCFTPN